MDRTSNKLRISVIIACLNASEFIEATLKSIVLQDYSNLELIVIDGGSTDGTLDIIRNFGDAVTYIVSEPDDGHYHAIFKGMSLATGDILCWINADDIYFPWTFATVNDVFTSFEDVMWIVGQPTFMNKSGRLVNIYPEFASYPKKFISNGWFDDRFFGFIQQESTFWRRSLWPKAGSTILQYDLAGDFALWTEFAKECELVAVATPLGSFRRRPGEQRSSMYRDRYIKEVRTIQAQLTRPPSIFRILSHAGDIGRFLIRALCLARSDLIIYHNEVEKWVRMRPLRPLATVSFRYLYIRWRLSRIK